MKPTEKVLYFDMDGTIFDLYGVNNWLEDLRNERVEPFIAARKMFNSSTLEKIQLLQKNGYKIGVITWLPKYAKTHYKKAVARVKKERLKKDFQVEISELHIVQYGTRKDYVAKHKKGVLFDDNLEVREKWRDLSIDPLKDGSGIDMYLDNLLKKEKIFF